MRKVVKTFGIPNLQDIKVSKKATSDALFRECLEKIRESKPKDTFIKPSPEIDQLTADELDITRKVFARIDPNKEVIPQISHRHHYIDPYWDPFTKVEEMKDEVLGSFAEYSRLVGAAESREMRMRLRKDLQRSFSLANPFSAESQRAFREATRAPPEPMFKPEKFWNPTPEWRQILRNNGRWMTFRGEI